MAGVLLSLMPDDFTRQSESTGTPFSFKVKQKKIIWQ
jgi:hypothetical protein